MKILFVTTLYPNKTNPSYCIFLEQQALALQSCGVETEILWLERDGDLIEAVYQQNGLLIHRVGIRWNAMDAIVTDRETRRILRFFSWEAYDAVSLHFGLETMKNTLMRQCKRKGVPVVLHYHGLNVWRDYYMPKGVLRRVYYAIQFFQTQRLLRNASAIVGVSNRVCDTIRKHARLNRLYTVYNGVNLQLFGREDIPFTGEKLRILCVGNLNGIKGQNYLVEAMKKVKEHMVPAELLLIGAGEEMEPLKRLVDEYGLTQDITFLGIQRYEMVAQYMRQADLFVLPSFFEAFGCVFVEAMGSGMLTCGCLDTGADEIITDGENGLLVEQKSVDAIVSVIEFAYQNPSVAQKIALQGQRRAHDFSWETSAERLISVYREII